MASATARREAVRMVLDAELISRKESRELDRKAASYRSQCDQARSALRNLECIGRAPNQDVIDARGDALELARDLQLAAKRIEDRRRLSGNRILIEMGVGREAADFPPRKR